MAVWLPVLSLNFGKQAFRRYGILPTVSAGMSEYAVGVGRFMLKQTFRDFVFSTNTDGSGKAASYVRALEIANKWKDDQE